jgi:glycosyltransferase involved in cell wall biosynthesis
MAKLEKERVEAGGDRKFHFEFAGKFFEEAEKQFFKKYIKDNGLEDFVTYHGIVGGKQKQDLLKKCDIFALLTRYPNEGQPISILEAMGNGMMIITTNHAGIPDIVEDGVNGVVVDKKLLNIKQCYQMIFEKSADEMHLMICLNRKKTQNVYNQKEYVNHMKVILGKV